MFDPIDLETPKVHPLSPPSTICGTHVRIVTFKHPLRIHRQSFGTLGQFWKIQAFVRQNIVRVNGGFLNFVGGMESIYLCEFEAHTIFQNLLWEKRNPKREKTQFIVATRTNCCDPMQNFRILDNLLMGEK